MSDTKIRPGTRFVEKDARMAGRTLRVLFVAEEGKLDVHRGGALCVSRGKLTTVSLKRLLDKTRYERLPMVADAPTGDA